jgi:hypothetical protein
MKKGPKLASHGAGRLFNGSTLLADFSEQKPVSIIVRELKRQDG